MFPERRQRSFLDHGRPVAAGGLPALRAAADAGERLGPASQPASRLERRVRRVPQVRARRRSAAARLAGVRPVGPVLRQGVRGRYQPALLPGARYQRLDGFRLGGDHARSNTPGGSPARSATWPSSRATRSAWPASPRGSSGTSRRGAIPSHLMAVFDVLEQTAAAGGDAARRRCCTSWPRRSRQRALVVIISDLFVEPELLRGCFQHLRFRKHDVAVFHLLDPQELALRLPPADAVPRHGRGPVDLRRAERDRRPLSEGARRLSRRRCARSCWSRPSTTTGCRSTRITSRS